MITITDAPSRKRCLPALDQPPDFVLRISPSGPEISASTPQAQEEAGHAIDHADAVQKLLDDAARYFGLRP